MKGKILKTEITEEGRALITVELTDDSGFSWEKVFDYYTTQEIKLDDLKQRIEDEVKQDLKVVDQLKEIKEQTGKEFNITIKT